MAGTVLKHLKDLKNIKLDGLRFRIVDAKGQIVGPLAQQIATMLQGKDKPTFSPKKNIGDLVIVVNASQVHFTHDQWNTKLYRWHTGYPGGLKQRTAVEQWQHDPCSIVREAVKGMLPKNKLQVFRLDKLKVFPEAEHPFEDFDLVPYVPPLRRINAPGLGWPLPEGFQPLNPERYAFRVRASPELREQPTIKVGFDDILTEEERKRL